MPALLRWSLAGLLSAAALVAQAGGFDKAEYAARRARLMARIPEGIAVVFGSPDAELNQPFSQNHDFHYLTGLDHPVGVLVLDGTQKKATLFLAVTEARAGAYGLPAAFAKESAAYTGLDQVLPPTDLLRLLRRATDQQKPLYVSFLPEEGVGEVGSEKDLSWQQQVTLNPWDGRLTRELQFVKHLHDRFPALVVKDLAPVLRDLRIFKTPYEIDCLRRAGGIGVAAHLEAMKACRPGVKEIELSAVYRFVCERAGALRDGYSVVLSSGPNHPFLHYDRHDRTLADGDIVVMDAGPEVDHYLVDITTTFPVNGRFTPRQREVYEAALAVLQADLAVYRPGLTEEQCRKEVAERLKQQGHDLEKPPFKGLQGGFGHYVGMSVHDPGFAPKELKPGMVFAVEPLLVLKDEALGVRVEETVLITEKGCEVLTPGLPRTVAEIEAVMKQTGMLQRLDGKRK